MAEFEVHVCSAVNGERLTTLSVRHAQTVGDVRSELGRCGSISACCKLLRQGVLLDDAATLEAAGVEPEDELSVVQLSVPPLLVATRGELLRWDPADKKPVSVCSVKGRFDGFSSDGQRVSLGGKILDTTSGRTLAGAHGKLSPDGKTGASIYGCDDDGLSVQEFETGRRHVTRTMSMDFLTFSMDGQTLLVAHGFCDKLEHITTWRVDGLAREKSYSFKDDIDQTGELDNFTLLSKDGSLLIGTLPAKPSVDRTREFRILGGTTVFAEAAGPACLSACGQRLFAAGRDGRARIFAVDTGEEMVAMHGLRSNLSSVAFSQDSALAVTGEAQKSAGLATVWDAETGACLVTVATAAPILGLAFESPGQLGVSATAPGGDAAVREGAAVLTDDADSEAEVCDKEAPLAFVVRTCAPTSAMIARLVDWATSLADVPHVDFHISVDATNDKDNVHCKRIADAFDERSCLQPAIHTYTEEQLGLEFPWLRYLSDASPHGSGMVPGMRSRPLAKAFRCEALSLWRKSLPDPGVYAYAWVFEDDVGYSGRIPELISSYASFAADLISGPGRKSLVAGAADASEGWNCYHVSTDAYKERTPETFVSDEFVQRFSSKLLDELDVWLQSGSSAWSQQMCVTVCHAAGMRWRPLRQQDIGHAWAWNTRVSEEEWQDLCQAVKNGQDRGKLFHALKS